MSWEEERAFRLSHCYVLARVPESNVHMFIDAQRIISDSEPYVLHSEDGIPSAFSPKPAAPGVGSPALKKRRFAECQRCNMNAPASGFPYCTTCCCAALEELFRRSNLEHRFVPAAYSDCVKEFLNVQHPADHSEKHVLIHQGAARHFDMSSKDFNDVQRLCRTMLTAVVRKTMWSAIAQSRCHSRDDGSMFEFVLLRKGASCDWKLFTVKDIWKQKCLSQRYAQFQSLDFDLPLQVEDFQYFACL